MMVAVSGQLFVFPPQCACCSGRSDSVLVVAATKSAGKKVVHSQTNTWNVPYCTACLSHVAWTQRGKQWLRGSIGFGMVIAILACIVSMWLGAVLLVLAVGFGVRMNAKCQATAKSICGTLCTNHAEAAFFLGWHGSVNSFDFMSRSYALAFMIANQRKLVNLTPDAAQLLNSAGIQPSSGRAQFAQRHRH